MSTQATPATKAASVPGRTGIHASLSPVAASLWHGSIAITLKGRPSLAASSRACARRCAPLAPPMRVSAGLAPKNTTRSAWDASESSEPV